MEKKSIVIKVGTNTLTDENGLLDRAYLHDLIDQIAELKSMGYAVVLVTSGAIAAGIEKLGLTKRPEDIRTLQATAAIGQVSLIDAYATELAKHDMLSAQILLTRHDTGDRHTYLHARDTLERLLELGVVPIINENDTVAIEEIAFGDNDTLAALVATIIDATLVLLLTDVDGLYTSNPRKDSAAQRIEHVSNISKEILDMASGVGSSLGSGGMVTKLRAARVLLASGIPMVLCHGRDTHVVVEAVKGSAKGTYFEPESSCSLNQKKRWIALGNAIQGTIVIDAGAVRALQRGGNSLLSAGITGVGGDFEAESPVSVLDENGMVIARGMCAYSSKEVLQIVGKHTDEALALVPQRHGVPVIHCDDMAVL